MILTEYFKTNFCAQSISKEYFQNHALYNFIAPLWIRLRDQYEIRTDYISDKIGFNIYTSFKKNKTFDYILNNSSKRTVYFFQNIITIDDNGVFNMEPNFIGLATLDLSIELNGMLLKNQKSMSFDQISRIKIFIIKNK